VIVRWLLDRGESNQSLDNLIESSSAGLAGAADTAPVPHLDEKTWHIRCDRTEAERLLHGRSDGTFLIRPSSMAPYALSIVWVSGIVHHWARKFFCTNNHHHLHFNGYFSCVYNISLSSVFCYRAGSGYPNGYPVLGNSQDGFPLPSLWFVITYCDQSFSFLGTVCPRHPPYPVLPSCPLSRALPYPQPGDASGCHSAPAICQSLTSADLMLTLRNLPMEIGEIIGIYVTEVVFTNARLGFGGTIRNFLQGEVASLFLSIEFRHGCRIFMYTRYCVILQMCTR